MTRMSDAQVEAMRRNVQERAWVLRVKATAEGKPDLWALAIGFGAGFGAVAVMFYGIPLAIALLNRGVQ